jgi:integrase
VQRQNLHTTDELAALRIAGPVIAQFRDNLRRAAELAKDAVPPKHAAWLKKHQRAQQAKVAELTRQLAQAKELEDWIAGQINSRISSSGNGNGDEPVPTFLEAAKQCITARGKGWKQDQWTRALAKHAYPSIGNLPIGQVDTEHVLRIIEPLWNSQHETASKLRQRIGMILDYARSKGWRNGDNPARLNGHLENLLPRKRVRVEHHKAMAWQDVPAFMARLRDSDEAYRWGTEFLVLTAARAGEVIGARWLEIDFEARVWTVPEQRMKQGRPHRVPLSDRCMAILGVMRGIAQGRHGDIVFPGRQGQAGRDAFRDVIDRLGADCVPHGLRSTFRDWVADSGRDGQLAEMALAHVKGDAVVRAYLRSDVLERRRVLMQEWADFCGSVAV